MKEHLRNLLINLVAGTRLARFAKVDRDHFRISPDQILLLVLVDLAIEAGFGYLSNLPQPNFNLYALPVYGFNFTLLLLASYLARWICSAKPSLLILPAALLSLTPASYGFWYSIYWASERIFETNSDIHTVIFVAYFVWIFAVTLRIIGLMQPISPRRHSIALIVSLATWFVPSWYYDNQGEFWYPTESDTLDTDPYAAFRKLSAEDIFYAQTPLIEQTVIPLKEHREGITDFYFVGFAGYARQDVFLKETRYAQNLFDEYFDTKNRSMVLANNLATYASTPLANGHNLALSLNVIGKKMSNDEDILVIYMTSHGSKEDGLSVDFWPLGLNDIRPETLKAYLDDAGIKWRILMISACYSGAFINALKDPFTIVATASAADRRSFGCGDHNDFTYFGEAVLKDQLSHSRNIIDSLREATVSIANREQTEGIKEKSEPQLFVGDAIAARLAGLELNLAGRKDHIFETQVQ